MIAPPLFLAALLALSFVAGGTAAVVGFGIGSLVTPLLVTRLDTSLAIGIVAGPHLLASAVRYWQHRRTVDRALLLRFGIPSMAGGLAGALLQSRLQSPALLGVLGALLVATSLANLSSGFGGWRPAPSLALALGGLSGLFGGVAGNQGGLRAAGLAAFDLTPRAFIATSTAVAVLIDVARAPVYVANAGAALRAQGLLIAVTASGCLAGTLLGERLFARLPRETHRRLVALTVGAVGVWLLTRAF